MIRPDRRWGGYALIECLVLMTVMAAIAALCAGTIHLLLRLDRAGRSSMEEAVDLARLARDFRADAHDADPAGFPSPNGDGLVLDLGESRSVEYAIRPGDVLRTVRVGGEIRKRELYRRPAKASARFDLAPEGPGRLVAIAFDRAPGDLGPAPRRDYRIEAELGKHRRLTSRHE